MTYANQAALGTDPAFTARVGAAITEQALVFKDDGRADIAALADMAIQSPAAAQTGMLPLVAAAPGFGDAADQATITDPQILSAVQAVWPTYAGVMFPPPPPS